MDKATAEEKCEGEPLPSRVVGEVSAVLQNAPIPAVRKRRLAKTAVESSSLTGGDSTQPYVSQGQLQQDNVTIEGCTSEEGATCDEYSQETSSVTRTITKTIKTSTSSSHEYSVEEYENSDRCTTPTTPLRLKQKVAMYEKSWQGGEGGGIKDNQSETSDMVVDMDSDNPFDIDVYEIEKRLREERKRGMLEAEAAKLAFQQIQLRATPSSLPRKVEIHEEHTASPFNVTLKTTSKISPGALTERIELEENSPKSPFNVTLRTTQRYGRTPIKTEEVSTGSPFNVTLRTTKRHYSSLSPSSPSTIDGKMSSAKFLEGERTVREVKAVDGITTIVTSSMTTDGRKHEEKIFRHGEGYFSPRSSPQREIRSSTPSRSVDMTAGGRRILIKLENEGTQESVCSSDESFDVTDYRVISESRFKPTPGGDIRFGGETVTLETPANIDIIVGTTSGNSKHHTVNLETKHEQMPWQTQQNYSNTTSFSTFTTKTTTKITTMSSSEHEHSETLASKESLHKTDSLSKTIQSQGSTVPGESHLRFVTKKTICNPSTSSSSAINTTSSTHKLNKKHTETHGSEHEALKKRLEIVGYGREGLGRGTGVLSSKTNKAFQSTERISDDSDTEGTAANSIVIVPTTLTAHQSKPPSESVEQTKTPFTPTADAAAGATHSSTLTKSLTSNQTQQHQSTSTSNEYQEIQLTMAAKQFARSNSQYDTHIKEKRGN